VVPSNLRTRYSRISTSPTDLAAGSAILRRQRRPCQERELLGAVPAAIGPNSVRKRAAPKGDPVLVALESSVYDITSL
jgi:hypothetical protein